MGEIIITSKRSDNEGTDSPYWLILDPKQNMSCNVHNLASQITGPFFCRKDAEDHLRARRYAFSKKATVYCLSGCYSEKYKKMWRQLEIEKPEVKDE